MPKKVLVIEDSAIVRNVHSTLLKSAGFEVSEAENNYVALEKAFETEFDLIVVDINTPKMDGYTFCKEIRAQKKYRNVSIMVVSTESAPEDKMKGLKAGADLYLVKPVKTAVFLENAKMLVKQSVK
ncbi:MAG: response regulator transcription factor [Proteobacteria bacterium]|nr:response regulator transcription factor [Pseudomonadota bacterium]